MKPIRTTISIIFLVCLGLLFPRPAQAATTAWWPVQSIDTMKYSRDVAAEKVADPAFDRVIEQQVAAIAQTGATHVAIATPYDDQFLPFLTRWVKAARKYHLKVWFRGNWSGWESWFGYDRINRAQHLAKTKQFILDHPGLFADGDIFTPCPECENGGSGDPRRTGDVAGFRTFLIDGYQTAQSAFAQIKKDVASNYFSMNGDVAKLIMDPATTQALDGIVVIDHYVATPDQLAADIAALARSSGGGQVVLGEFGAPIGGIHGQMSQEEQAKWLDQALKQLVRLPELVGVNYWVSVGGETQLWQPDGTPRKAVSVIKQFYQPQLAQGQVKNQINRPVPQATVQTSQRATPTDGQGKFTLPFLESDPILTIRAPGYREAQINLNLVSQPVAVVLEKEQENFIFALFKRLQQVLGRLLGKTLTLQPE